MFGDRRTIALVKRAARGDREAFTALIDENRQYLYATAMTVTHNEDDAMDAVQDTVFTVWCKLDTLRDPGAFRTWMTRILLRSCLNVLRGRRGALSLEEIDEPGEERDRDTGLDVRSALAKLGEDDRLVLQLFYFEDMSVKDIARVLSIRPEAVKMRLSRGRKRFRKAYGEVGGK